MIIDLSSNIHLGCYSN